MATGEYYPANNGYDDNVWHSETWTIPNVESNCAGGTITITDSDGNVIMTGPLTSTPSPVYATPPIIDGVFDIDRLEDDFSKMRKEF